MLRPLPDPLIIANRPLMARLLLLFWLAEVAVGLLFAAAGVRLVGPAENGGAAVLILMGVVLAGVGVVMTALCWRISFLRGPAIEMTAEGLLDHRLSGTRLPWEAIRWRVMFNGRSYAVQFDLDEPVRSAAALHWPQRALGLFSRAMRQPEFTLGTLGTGLSAHELGKRLERFSSASS